MLFLRSALRANTTNLRRPPVVQWIADAIPAARFAVLPRAPHMLFIEQPEEMARTFAPSLRDIARTHNR